MEIPGFEEYIINEEGRIFDTIKNRFLITNAVNGVGYKVVNLRSNGKRKYVYIHRLLAICFLDNPKNYSIVDHINMNKLDNCLTNLRWSSYSENSLNCRRSINAKKNNNKI